MFELISEKREGIPQRETMPMVVSTAVHAAVVGGLLVLPLLYVADRLPEIPTMMAFVAAPPPPAPPPPPPPPPAGSKAAATRPVATAGQFAAPVEAPSAIVEET